MNRFLWPNAVEIHASASSIQEIHARALQVARQFMQAEADLISVLQEIDGHQVFLLLGFASLFQYCIDALGLSESVTWNFVVVARKAQEVPKLHEAIQEGSLSVSKARKITSVLTAENGDEWVEKAKTLSTRKSEEEVAKADPKMEMPEKMTFIDEDRVRLQLGITKVTQEKLRLAQDLESQRRRRAASLEDCLEAMLEVYLEVKDISRDKLFLLNARDFVMNWLFRLYSRNARRLSFDGSSSGS